MRSINRYYAKAIVGLNANSIFSIVHHMLSFAMPFSWPLRLWHLLSLDAPTVATLWTWFAARATGVAVPAPLLVSIFASVWILYVVDRLLDAQPVSSARKLGLLSERHRFHNRHRSLFIAGIILCLPALILALWYTPFSMLEPFLWLSSILFVYCCLIHAVPMRFPVPRECVVGAFFCVAVFIPTVGIGWKVVPAAFVFSLACMLNCIFIHIWEKDSLSLLARPHLAIGLSLGMLLLITFLHVNSPSSLYAACGLSVALFLLLHATRHRFNPTTLRASADFALLTPILFLSAS